MTTLYKITRPDLTTYGGYRYRPGVTERASGTGPLCSGGHLHAYLSPELAVLLNPIHGNYAEPYLLWRARGTISARDHELKVGCSALTLLRQVPIPVATTEQRVMFALWCVLAVTCNPAWIDWAEGWLAGEDRSARSAKAAEAAAAEAAEAAEAAWAAAEAAEAAASAAAWAAAWAAAEAAVPLPLVEMARQALRVAP